MTKGRCTADPLGFTASCLHSTLTLVRCDSSSCGQGLFLLPRGHASTLPTTHAPSATLLVLQGCPHTDGARSLSCRADGEPRGTEQRVFALSLLPQRHRGRPGRDTEARRTSWKWGALCESLGSVSVFFWWVLSWQWEVKNTAAGSHGPSCDGSGPPTEDALTRLPDWPPQRLRFGPQFRCPLVWP